MIVWIVTGVVLGLFLLSCCAACFLYRKNFHTAFPGHGPVFPAMVERYPGWRRKPVEFSSLEGKTLRGWLFFYPEREVNGLVLLYHGYGMTAEDYLPEAECFCRRGYRVLAFDGTGTGRSDGVLTGLPQHVLDLEAALDYVAAEPELSRLPLLLYGHSWGGYACTSLGQAGRDDPIRGLIAAAPFRTSLSGMHNSLRRRYGVLGIYFTLYVRLIQRLHYGAAAGWNGVDGLKALTCPVLLLQSRDDAVIPFEDNFGVFQRAFGGDPRITLAALEGRNHNLTTPPEADRRRRELLRKGSLSPEEQEEWKRLSTVTDEVLLGRFADFFDKCLEGENSASPQREDPV